MNEETERWRANLQGEVDASAVYKALAQSEPDPNRAAVYTRLAAVEAAHAEFWRAKLRSGAVADEARPRLHARMVAWAAQRLGAKRVLPLIATLEQRGAADYAAQSDALAAGLAAEEAGHAQELAALTGEAQHATPHRERHSRASANALRAAVLGANDGLVSNFCLVMGMAGAAPSGRVVLLAGLAGLVAGALSMAIGEWLSVANAREQSQRELRLEANEIAADPNSEKAELTLIYQSKGISAEQAVLLADAFFARPETALEALAREELGLDPGDPGGSPAEAALASFCLFALGAAIPIAPYLAGAGALAPAWSFALSALALVGIGALTSIFNGRGVAYSAARQVAFGAAAAAVTFFAGRLVGGVV